jgi:hypothetical protein
MNTSTWNPEAMGYSTVETLLDEVSRNMAASNLSRYSRGLGGHAHGHGQRMSGSSRVVKSGSTNNSPRNSVGLGRRMTDGAHRKRLTMMDQNTLDSSTFTSNDGIHRPMQARPVSWHPTSYYPQQPHQPFQMDATYHSFDLPPTPIVYSSYASPVSGYAPLSVPYGGYEQPIQSRPHTYHPTQHEWNPDIRIAHPLYPDNTLETTNIDSAMYTHFDWNNFATNGFDDPTAPPTPDNLLPIQHSEPSFPPEEAIPYQTLDDSDDTGEELIGMGLYDNTPDAGKTFHPDPHLDNYPSLMMPQLLGTPFRRQEPVGKGLKLEETWDPPTSDNEEDEDEDEDNSEDDGEGEDDDEAIRGVADVTALNSGDIPVSSGHVQVVRPSQGVYMKHNFGQDGWL